MRQDLNAIANRLADLGVPSHLVAQHVHRVTNWRASHPKKIKRHRRYDNDDQPLSRAGKRLKPKGKPRRLR